MVIDPAPTPGVGIPLDGLLSALPVLSDPFSGAKVVSMSKEFFGARFANGLPRDPAWFPLGVWLQSPHNAQRYRDIGVNLYVGLYEGPTEAQLDALEAIAEPQRSPLKGAKELAVFGSPRELRAAYARGVARSRDARALRRHDRLPGWALRAMPREYTASLPARPGSDEGQPS